MQVAEAFPLSDILSVLEGADWREWSLEDVGTHREQRLPLKVGSLSASYVAHAGRIRADVERTCNALGRTPLGAAAMQRDGSAARLGEQDGGGPAPAARGGQRQQKRETKGDPLVGWLRREIDAARKALRSNPSQGVYHKATLDYLDAVGDLLRY
jgi:hypothetical protein